MIEIRTYWIKEYVFFRKTKNLNKHLIATFSNCWFLNLWTHLDDRITFSNL